MRFIKGLVATIVLFISLSFGLVALDYIRIEQETRLSSTEPDSEEELSYYSPSAVNRSRQKTASYSEPSDAIDRELMNLNLIDNDYRYVDIPNLEAYLEEKQNFLTKQLPTNGIIDMDFKPYNETVTYKLDRKFSEKEIQGMRDLYSNEFALKKHCNDTYDSRYKAANNVVVDLIFYDLDMNLVAEISLDNEVCS